MWGINSPQKRKRLEEGNINMFQKENQFSDSGPVLTGAPSCPRSFIRIQSGTHTFHTDNWKSKSTTIYTPLGEDIMVNLRNIDQISLANGSFHIGDDQGTYTGSSQGHVLHLWRYDDRERQLYISRSFLFIELQAFNFVRRQLNDV